MPDKNSQLPTDHDAASEHSGRRGHEPSVAVLGAGPMGLACAYELSRHGISVTVYEASPQVVGHAFSTDFAGQRVEPFYHWYCTTDSAFFSLLEELNLCDALSWSTTRMACFDGRMLQPWGDPLSLLRFKGLSLLAKLRYGLHAYRAVHLKNSLSLDHMTAREWITAQAGEEAWLKMWEPLLKYKLWQYSDYVSAAWIQTRMRRLGLSRKNLFTERLCYVKGGSDTWLQPLCQQITSRGGTILNDHAVTQVTPDGKGSFNVTAAQGSERNFDAVVSTVPMQTAGSLFTFLPEQIRDFYRSVPNLSLVSVMGALRRSLSPYYWINLSPAREYLPGIIEFSRINPFDGHTHLIYAPWYLPEDSTLWQESDTAFIERSKRCLCAINPELVPADFLDFKVVRAKYAQPVCLPGYAGKLPELSPVPGLYIADTSSYYPSDRLACQSIALGRKIAASILSGSTRIRRDTQPHA